MIWHIFKKDWRLEWRLALGVALVQAILTFILWRQGATLLANLLALAAVLARGFLIVETAHNDPIPGVRQDWLIRPIRRSELLATKILFAALVVQGPVFVGDLAEALANGFSFGASMEAALSRSFYLFLAFSLPVLAISSFTKNLLEVLAVGVGGFLLIVVGNFLTEASGPPIQKLTDTAIGWTAWNGCLVVLTGLVAAILLMQYRRRVTVASRWVAAAGALVLTGILMLPWQAAAFALQSRLSPTPAPGNKIELAFNPSPTPISAAQRAVHYGTDRTTMLRIPLAVAGLPDDSIMAADHYEMRLTDSSGVIRAESRSLMYSPDELTIERQRPGPIASVQWHSSSIYATVLMNSEDYLRLRNEKVHIEINYSLTLMQVAETYAIPAVNGNERLPGFGWCRTRVSPLGDAIQLTCMQAGRPPDCYLPFLEHAPSGRRNPVNYRCSDRDYSPSFAQFFPDSIVRFGNPSLKFHDSMGEAHYEVDAPDIGQAQVVIRNYRALDHFTRTVTTPEAVLSSWLAK